MKNTGCPLYSSHCFYAQTETDQSRVDRNFSREFMGGNVFSLIGNASFVECVRRQRVVRVQL